MQLHAIVCENNRYVFSVVSAQLLVHSSYPTLVENRRKIFLLRDFTLVSFTLMFWYLEQELLFT